VNDLDHEDFFYSCSKEYVQSIDASLYSEVYEIISKLPKRQKQEEINNDLFWLLIDKGWSYDTLGSISDTPPTEMGVTGRSKPILSQNNNRSLCVTSTTLAASWHSDFGKAYGSNLVQIEAQFGKVESMFKDFCGFRIARHERRLALGIEIVLCEPPRYFSHRRNAVGGMAYFDIAKNTLPAIGLNCPIWLVGIKQ
jgi:hypothetical protein